MAFKITFSIPVFRIDSWLRVEHHATLEITREDDNLLESYTLAQAQLAELLKLTNCEVQLARDLQKLTAEVSEKEKKLRVLNFKVEQSQREYDSLRRFFTRLGIEVSDNHRCFKATLFSELQYDDYDDDDDDDGEVDE